MADENQSLQRVVSQAREFTRSLNTRQKYLLAAGTLAVVVMLLLFVSWATQPEMKTLYSGMEASDAQALSSKLAARNIKAKISPDGTAVSVPADKLDAARMEVASQQPARTGRMGFEIFDQPTWASSDFHEQVNFQRAVEGELERTIQTLDDVVGARVHLAVPEPSIFNERNLEAKATVVLKLKRGTISQATQEAIARLVAGAVQKLRPENVAVIDADTNRLIGEHADSSFKSSASQKVEDELAARVVHTLQAVVGQDGVRAAVHIELDPSTSEESQESYDPNSAVALQVQRSEERNGGAAPSGIPGTASNLPGGNGRAGAIVNNESQSKSEKSSYAVNRLVRHTVMPSGRVRKIYAAILVDDQIRFEGKKEIRQQRSADQIKQIEELARTALGIDNARGDQLTVQNISFQRNPSESPVVSSKAETLRRISNEWAVVIRAVTVLVLFAAVYLILLRPLKNQMVKSLRSVEEERRSILVKHTEANSETPEATPEMQVGNLSKELSQKIKAEPTTSTRLLQSWLHEGATE